MCNTKLSLQTKGTAKKELERPMKSKASSVEIKFRNSLILEEINVKLHTLLPPDAEA